jgi:hypothetical protein
MVEKAVEVQVEMHLVQVHHNHKFLVEQELLTQVVVAVELVSNVLQVRQQEMAVQEVQV